MEEIWKDIEGYEGLYQVSNFGRVRSCDRAIVVVNNGTKCLKHLKGKVMVLSTTPNGYLMIHLCKNGKCHPYTIHRLVANAFIPNPDGLPIVNHKDENKHNNAEWNLEYCDCCYNVNFGTAIKRRAEKCINGKKTKAIYQFDLEGNLIKQWVSAVQINKELGYDPSLIGKCCKNKKDKAYGFKWAYQ